jgi:hypothetical protein
VGCDEGIFPSFLGDGAVGDECAETLKRLSKMFNNLGVISSTRNDRITPGQAGMGFAGGC